MEHDLTEDERTALAHLRGHCHNGETCPVCKAFQSGRVYGRQEAFTPKGGD